MVDLLGWATGSTWSLPTRAAPARRPWPSACRCSRIPSEAGGGPGTAGLPGRLVVVGVGPSEVDDVAAAAVGSFVTFTWSGR